MSRYTRILSIDGGGIRGVLPAMILVKLEEILRSKTGNNDARLADYFDLVAGTSTGGIIACGMLLPDGNRPPRPQYTASEVADIYLKEGGKIFGRRKPLTPLFDERYSHDALLDVLDEYLGDNMLSDLLKPTLITAYDIKRRKAHFFRQHKADRNSKNDFFARDVAWATAAAPTFFEVSRVESASGKVYPFIDGGVFANNPALCAYAEARASLKSKPTAKDMVILSLGTGKEKEHYSYKKAKDWGLLKWAKAFSDITISGVSETVTYQLEQIYDSVGASDQFVRIDPKLAGASPELDNASRRNLRQLRRAGVKAADYNEKALKDFAGLLLM